MLPRYLGDLAGLDFGRLPTLIARGIEGAGIKAYKGSVILKIAEFQLPPLACVYTESSETPLVLGREGFFDLFTITFDNRRQKTVLTPLF